MVRYRKKKVLSKIKVNFSLTTGSGGRWSQNRWYGPPWCQHPRSFVSLLCVALTPKFISSSNMVTLGHAIAIHLHLSKQKKRRIRMFCFPLRTLPGICTQFPFICHSWTLSVIAKTACKGVSRMWNLFHLVIHPSKIKGSIT